MVHITITDELAEAIAQAGTSVTLIDSRGRTIAQMAPAQPDVSGPLGMTAQHWDELRQRVADDDGTRLPFLEVTERIRAVAPE